MGRITSELVLLGIRSTEYDISQHIEEKYGDCHAPVEFVWMVDKVTCLKRVCKRYSGQVTKDKHESKSVMNNVHRCEDAFFEPE